MTKPVLFDNLTDFINAGNQRQNTIFNANEWGEEDANPAHKKTVILYHANCWDGITAAWCAWLKFKSQAVYIPVQYGKPLPNVDWSYVAQVYILDFSYQREILDELYAIVNGALVVLDHHKTAEEQLRGAPYACFAKGLSGAGMAWLYFQERHTFLSLARGKHGVYGSRMCMNTMPKHVYHAQDYDLWAFKDKETKAFRAAQDLYPREIETIQKIHDARVNATNPLNVSALVAKGKVILEQKMKMVDEAAANAFRFEFPGEHGYGYGVINNNPSLTSELGNVLALRSQAEGDSGYAAIFSVNAKSIQHGDVMLSLRSVKGVDTTGMAMRFGGGGHAQASGCKWGYAYFLQFMGYLGVKAQKEET